MMRKTDHAGRKRQRKSPQQLDTREIVQTKSTRYGCFT